jgi:F0F1-type ATP synthase assembly protein I
MSQPPRSPVAYVGAGFEVVAPVVLLMLAGYWLDGRFASEPWFLLSGALLGIAVGLYTLLRRFLRPGPGAGGTTS